MKTDRGRQLSHRWAFINNCLSCCVADIWLSRLTGFDLTSTYPLSVAESAPVKCEGGEEHFCYHPFIYDFSTRLTGHKVVHIKHNLATLKIIFIPIRLLHIYPTFHCYRKIPCFKG